MIEFLPPRDGVFGESGTPDFVGFDGDDTDDFGDEPPRSRWLTALAVIGVTGLLAGGVIAAAPWDSDQTATPATTTTPPTTTPPPTTAPRSTTTTEPSLPPGVSAAIPGMLATEPGPYVLFFAESIDDENKYDLLDSLDPIEVWMSPDASRNAGRWVVIDSRETSSDVQALRRDATRVDAGTRPALLIARPDGVVEIEVPVTDGVPFSVSGFGLTLPELIRIASTVRIDAREIDHGDLLAPGGPFDGLEQRVADDVAWFPGGFSNSTPDAISAYVDESGSGWIQVSVDAPDPTTQLLDELIGLTPVQTSTLSLRGLSGWFSLSKRFDLVTVVRSDVNRGFGFVTFALRDRRIVTVAGQIGIDELLSFAAQLELAEPGDWRDAVIDASEAGGRERQGSPPTVIGESALGEWQAQIYGSGGSAWVAINGRELSMGETFDPETGPHLTSYRSVDKTFVLATNTWPNTARRVVIAQPGVEPQELALAQIQNSAMYALVAELDAALPYTVQWLDADGVAVPGPTVADP